MRIRHPVGRAGRPWLAHRLEVARRGAELLDDKHLALAREHHRLEPLAARAQAEWERAAREAERALTRAAVLGGQPQLDLGRAAAAAAGVTVRWRSVLGVRCPVDGVVERPGLDARGSAPPPGGSAALIAAAGAHRAALDAAVRAAVLQGALARVKAELEATALRRNAIRHRWIPAHEEAEARLLLTLEEHEREDATHARWAGEGPAGHPG